MPAGVLAWLRPHVGRPVWVDDPHFDLNYHVRHTALPAPGDDKAFTRLMGRLMSQPLDRERPLWETWLVEGLEDGLARQTLLGVTGSGKTFTVANVIQEVQRPAIILAPNKTLAAQLYGEFKQFFPDNLVEYFVSYYDYYQPEAYIPSSNLYIEKDLSINDEIEKLRLSATSALLSGRRDVIVVASVSCIYGIGNPSEFHKSVIHLEKGQLAARNSVLRLLVAGLYSRQDHLMERGKFRVKGDTIDVYPAYADHCIRLEFFGDEVDRISTFEPESGETLSTPDRISIYPANLFVTTQATMNQAIWEIQQDMAARVDYFKEAGRPAEAERLEERTTYDVEMMRELGYCSGIENYSRYFDRRQPGERPFCLLDYFPEDYLMVVDESHVTLPQVRAMYGGDRSRKVNLVEYGFRLPAALDNRPLKFEEFEAMMGTTIYVSATPADYELQKSEGVIVEQLIRPTGLPDPKIYVRPSENQIDDLMEEIDLRSAYWSQPLPNAWRRNFRVFSTKRESSAVISTAMWIPWIGWKSSPNCGREFMTY